MNLVTLQVRQFDRRAPRPPRARRPPAGHEALDRLKTYRWPGNVRELENAIERAVALEESEFSPRRSRPVPRRARAAGLLARQKNDAIPPTGFNLEQHLQDIERTHIERALKQADGVQVRAADLLGLSFRQFRYLAKKYAVR